MRYTITLIIALCTLVGARAQVFDTASVSVYFDYDRFEMRDDAYEAIDKALRELAAPAGQYQAHLYGYTDQDGTNDYNQKLSEQRARVIRQYLIGQGMLGERITYVGKGEREARTDVRGKIGGQRDRRVEVVLTRYVPKAPPAPVAPVAAEPPTPPQLPRRDMPSQEPMIATFDAAEGIVLQYDRSDTKVTIPPGALVYADGTPVVGEVELEYLEYRNLNDIAASDLPMHYEDKEGSFYQYNSTGMYRIEATQGGQPLGIAPGQSVQVDFEMTERLPETNFYQLDTATGLWQEAGMLVYDMPERNGSVPRINIDDNCIRDTEVGRDSEPTSAPDGATFLAGLDWLEQFVKASDKEARQTLKIIERGYLQATFGNRAYAGIYKVPDPKYRVAATSDEYYNLRLQVERHKKRYRFKIKDVTGEHAELRALRAYTLEAVDKADNRRLTPMLEQLLESPDAFKWCDARLLFAKDYQDGDAFSTMLLRLESTGKRVAVEVLFRDKNGKKLNANEVSKLYRSYTRKLQARDTLYRPDYIEYCEAARYALLEQSIAFGPCVEYTTWLTALRKPHNRPYVLDQIQRRRAYPLSEQQWTDFITERYEATQERMRQQIANAIRIRRASSGMRAVTELIDFGTYNCDQIRRLRKPRKVLVRAVTPEGELLSVTEVRVLNSRLNSAMIFRGQEIAYEPDPKTQNALLITDSKGHCYLVDSRSFRQRTARRERYRATPLPEDWAETVDLEKALFPEI